jgi:hypothetical protein
MQMTKKNREKKEIFFIFAGLKLIEIVDKDIEKSHTFVGVNLLLIHKHDDMKKLFLFIYFAGVLAFFGYSQTLSVLDTVGNVLANDSYYNTNGTPTDDEIVTYLFVKNNTANPVSVLVKKAEISVQENSINMFCWGLCFAPQVFIAPEPKVIEGNAVNELDFSGHYVPNGARGVSVIRYTFFVTENPNDSVCVNVTFSAFPLGVANATAKPKLSAAFPNPATSFVNFNVSGTGHGTATLVVRNILGSVVRELNVTGFEGKVRVETAGLNDGVYFCSMLVNGEATATRKIVVRH